MMSSGLVVLLRSFVVLLLEIVAVEVRVEVGSCGRVNGADVGVTLALTLLYDAPVAS